VSTERKPFSLKLFGGCVLDGPDGLVTGRAAQPRRLACLAHVAAAGRAGTSRDRLVSLLWPDSPPEQARHRLADTLYVLRAALGPDALAGAGERVVVRYELLACDVVRFEEALARGDVTAAAAAYGGPFLDGFHVDDAPDFAHWADGERERLARLASRAFAGLARARAAAGDHAGAADGWRRAAAQDPYSSRVAVELMHALDAAGDHAAAIRHASDHAAALRDALGAEPDPAVPALAERLRRMPASPTPAGAGVPPDAPRPLADAAAGARATFAPSPPVADPPPAPAFALAPPRARSGRRIAGLALVCGAVLAVRAVAPGGGRPAPGPPSRTPPDPVATDLYLRGRHYWSLDTPEGIRRGIDYFWRAVDQDPTYALAYAGLADGYARLDDMSALPADVARPRALAAARRAIALDSTVAQAHAALAHILMHRWQWTAAEREFRIALALDPDYATAHLWYGVQLMAVGRVDEAAAQVRRARALDPLSVGVSWLAGATLGNVGHHAEAVAVLDGTLERVPATPGCATRAPWRWSSSGATPRASRSSSGSAARSRSPGPARSRGARPRRGASCGRRRRGRRPAGRRSASTRAAPPSSPSAYVALGAYDRALDWLEREVESGSNMTMALKADTRLAPLRGHPRYRRLLQRLGVS
jgi:DNA-binding SARP family transcriptional activator